MSDNIHGPDANERHERNKKALRYLSDLEKRDEQNEQLWKEQWQARGLGCLCILILNCAIWYLIYCVCKALGEL